MDQIQNNPIISNIIGDIKKSHDFQEFVAHIPFDGDEKIQAQDKIANLLLIELILIIGKSVSDENKELVNNVLSKKESYNQEDIDKLYEVFKSENISSIITEFMNTGIKKILSERFK